MTSVIIPAHNEATVIRRLLTTLLGSAKPGEFDVVVVSNGSTDKTADRAREYDAVRVVEIAEASKHRALIEGDRLARGFPVLYVDADVELDTDSARALAAALQRPGTLAVAPERELVLTGSSWAVRAYYRVWARLPAVRGGLFGRGVIGLSADGAKRIADRPQLIGDDLFVDSRFAENEREIVAGSRSVVRGPKTIRDLIRRRVRAAQGNTQLGDVSGGRTVTTASSGREVARLAAREPGLWPSLAVFAAVTLVARRRARRMRMSGQEHVWLRDDSSRT